MTTARVPEAVFPTDRPGVELLEPLPAERHTRSYRLPYQLGLYTAINAISDAYAVIDGPDCLYRKAEWVHGKHDLNSTLLDAMGEHRIVSTLLYSSRVIKSDGSEVRDRIRRVARIPKVGAALVCSMPHVMIIGTQYDRILADLQPEIPFPMLEVPSRSLDGDWLDGYDETLLAIARHIALPSAAPRPGRVALVGYLFDRNEEDNRANTAELRRLCEALGLEVTSVWLDGSRYEDLAAAGEAELVVALPHGKRAAHALAGRSGARVLDLPLPFGLRATRRFVRGLGRAVGRLDRADALCEAELARAVPRLEWVVPHYFAGKRVAFAGDPHCFPGFLATCEELGMTVPLLAASARRPEGLDFSPEGFEPVRACFAPSHTMLDRVVAEAQAAPGLDLFVGNSTAHLSVTDAHPRPRLLELGFPSFHRHALFDAPTLGFRGWIWLVDAMLGALSTRG